LCALLKIILNFPLYLKNDERYPENSNGSRFSTSKALPTRNVSRKYFTNTAHCQKNLKHVNANIFALVKITNFKFSDLFVCPQKQSFNASSNNKFKKKFAGP
jgi:hypothetical protein